MASYIWPPEAGGSGTVTSIAFADGSTNPIFSISGSPITTNGTITETLVNQNANTVFAGPTTGAAAQPAFRALVAADLSSASGNLTDVGTDGIIITNGNGAVIGTGTSIAQHVADTSHNGYLDSTDWNTFNGKQPSGSYITALTGDGTASGPGSAALTLATVNTNVGTFASVTVNGKGLVTAASALSGDATTSGAVLTLDTVNSNVGTFASATFNAKGLATAAAALSGDATTSGSALTLATVNTNVGSFSPAAVTVNAKGLVTAASSVTTGNLTDSTSAADGITVTGGTGAVLGSGTSIAQAKASGSQNGYLSSTDWTTFNNKATPLSGLTTDGVVYATSSSAVASTALGSQYQPLCSNGGGAPTFQALSIGQPGVVTGILPVPNGTPLTVNLGTTTTTESINWSDGSLFTFTLTSGNTCVVSFNSASSGQIIVIEVTNGSSGGTGAVTWPTVKWSGGTPPTQTVGTSALDVYTFIYNGSYYVGSVVQNLS